MNFRRLAGEKVSILGYGCMRFPTTVEGKIDREATFELLQYAYNNGVNYFDTAWIYHDGESEVLLGEFIKRNDRARIKLATKLPVWLIKTEDDFEKILSIQLDKISTDYIDYYLMHALNKKTFELLKKNHYIKHLDAFKNSGKVKYIGFSFHDEMDLFKEIMDDYKWDFCQIQLNFIDENYQAGLEGLRYAAKKKIDLVIMEPLRGGVLANNVPQDVLTIWEKSQIKREPVDWALKYLWNMPQIKVVLSGMNSFKQVKQNIEIASNSTAGILSEYEIGLIQEVKNKYREKIKVDCTGCKYCMPCPHGVDIARCFQYYNIKHMVDDPQFWHYNAFLQFENKASNCRSCGICVPKCPQNIDIPKRLKDVVTEFGS